MRVLAGTDATVRLHLLDSDGEPVTPDTPPQVDVIDSAGEAVTGSPFTGTTVGEQVTATLPAAITDTLDTYLASAVATVGGSTAIGNVQVETVGGFLFGIGQLRTREPNLDDEAIYPLDLLRQVREAAEVRFERGARRAFVPRARRVAVPVGDDGTIALPDIDITEVVAVSVADTVYDVADVALTGDTYGALYSDATSWTCGDLASVLYVHGMPAPPGPVTEAVMRLARDIAVSSSLPSRATAMTSELGTFRLTIPGRDGPTGIPDVDAVMVDFGRPEGAIG